MKLKISEQEFYLVSMLEKEVMENLMDLLRVDDYFAVLDAYLSLNYAASTFELSPPNFSDKISVKNGFNICCKYQIEKASQAYFK